MVKMNQSDFFWLAGIIEAEGCYRWERYSPRIRVGMTDKDVIARVATLFDRPYYKKNRQGKPHWKQMWTTSICGKPALELMIALVPIMSKRRQAKIKGIERQYNRKRHIITKQDKKGDKLVTISKRAEFHWLSGLLEGEAWFCLEHNSPRIGIEMTDEDVIVRVAKLFNRSYYRRVRKDPKNGQILKRKIIYTTKLGGKASFQLMHKLSPLMGKRRKAKIKEIKASCSQGWRTHIPIKQAENIRKLYKTGKYSYRGLADKFNVPYYTAWKIATDRTWKEL